MSLRSLKNYLSRSQIRDFLGYLRENGASEIVESPDHTGADAPMPIRIGAALNSIREFHVGRDLPYRVNELGYAFSDNDSKPELPEGSNMVGVLYMSKTKDYSGDADKLGDESHLGDIGDTIWFEAESWNSFELGETKEGNNYRLFAFWGKIDEV